MIYRQLHTIRDRLFKNENRLRKYDGAGKRVKDHDSYAGRRLEEQACRHTFIVYAFRAGWHPKRKAPREKRGTPKYCFKKHAKSV